HPCGAGLQLSWQFSRPILCYIRFSYSIAKIESRFSAQARSIKIAEPGRQGWAMDRLGVAPARTCKQARPWLGLPGNFCPRRTPDPEPISTFAGREPRGNPALRLRIAFGSQTVESPRLRRFPAQPFAARFS